MTLRSFRGLWESAVRESHPSVVRPGEYFRSHPSIGALHNLQHHLDFFLLLFITETCKGLLLLSQGSSRASYVPLLAQAQGEFSPNHWKPMWKSEVQDCDFPKETALKTSSYSCNAADVRVAAKLHLALKNADTKAETPWGTKVMFAQSCWVHDIGC